MSRPEHDTEAARVIAGADLPRAPCAVGPNPHDLLAGLDVDRKGEPERVAVGGDGPRPRPSVGLDEHPHHASAGDTRALALDHHRTWALSLRRQHQLDN